jgi:hypothetical protein
MDSAGGPSGPPADVLAGGWCQEVGVASMPSVLPAASV